MPSTLPAWLVIAFVAAVALMTLILILGLVRRTLRACGRLIGAGMRGTWHALQPAAPAPSPRWPASELDRSFFELPKHNECELELQMATDAAHRLRLELNDLAAAASELKPRAASPLTDEQTLRARAEGIAKVTGTDAEVVLTALREGGSFPESVEAAAAEA